MPYNPHNEWKTSSSESTPYEVEDDYSKTVFPAFPAFFHLSLTAKKKKKKGSLTFSASTLPENDAGLLC